MKKMLHAFSKQLFGAKYESIRHSLSVCVILFIAVYAAEIRLPVAPYVLFFASTGFSMCIMWQMLHGSRQAETLKGMFLLPFENRDFVFSYVLALGGGTILTKTLPVWTLFFAVKAWSGFEIAAAFVCGVNACFLAAAFILMFQKKNYGLPAVWIAGIFFVIFFVRQAPAVFAVSLLSWLGAALSLRSADAYAFYPASQVKRPARHKGRKGSVFVYLARYLSANPSYLVNTAGLCGIACFLPLLFGSFEGIRMLPLGFAILSINTPIGTLLSSDQNLEQSIRMLPGQTVRFCSRYSLFLCMVSGFIYLLYLCSWQLIYRDVGGMDIWTAALFALQSAVLTVLLEWMRPVRGWKTESDLWHHPRKYLVPLVLLLIAAGVGTWASLIWIWSAVLPLECCFLLRKGAV